MTSGLAVYNTSNYFQITEQFKNLVLIAKGQVNFDGTPGWQPGGGPLYGCHATITLPNTTGYPPVLALRCDVYVAIFRTRLVGSNWVWDLVSELGYTLTNAIQYFAFGPTPNSSPANFGFEVRTAANELAYHSSYLPMRVTDYQSSLQGSPGTFNVASGKSLAIALLSSAWSWTQQVPSGTWQQFLLGTAVRTTSSTAGDVKPALQYGQLFQAQNYGFGAGGGGYWAAAAVDITGY